MKCQRLVKVDFNCKGSAPRSDSKWVAASDPPGPRLCARHPPGRLGDSLGDSEWMAMVPGPSTAAGRRPVPHASAPRADGGTHTEGLRRTHLFALARALELELPEGLGDGGRVVAGGGAVLVLAVALLVVLLDGRR